MVEVAALPQKPQCVAGADPVVAVILTVAVAGDDLVSVRKRLVHALDVVGLEDVVGIKNEVAVKARGVVPIKVVQQRLQCVAFAHLFAVGPLVAHRPGTAGDERRVVGTVVGQHEDGDQILIVALAADTGDEIADDGGLVAGADQHGVAVLLRCGVGLGLFQPRHGNVEKLVGVADDK